MIIQKKVRIILLSLILLILLGGMVFVGATGYSLARYEANETKPMHMTYSGVSGQMYFNILTENTTIDEEGNQLYETVFMCSNGLASDNYCTIDQTGEISLFAALGLDNPDNVIVTLQDGLKKYEGRWTEVKAGMRQYASYGPGWLYQFYDGDGNKLLWDFSGETFVQREMKIIISGQMPQHTLFRMIAKATPKAVSQNITSFQIIPTAENPLPEGTDTIPPAAESISPLRSDLLRNDGQIIIVNNNFQEKTIPITIYGDSSLNTDETKGTISVTSNDGRMKASTDVTEFTMSGEQIVFNLKLEYAENPDTEEIADTPLIDILVNYQNQILKATIQLQMESEIGSGTLAYWQSQYEPGDDITLQTGEQEGCSLAGFPHGTSYVLDGTNYLLYDVGMMILQENKNVQVLIPPQEAGTTVNLTAQEGTIYPISQIVLPDISHVVQPFIIGLDGMEYPIAFNWGTLHPEIQIQHLTRSETGLTWNDTENILCQTGENSLTTLTPVQGATEAGTYKAVLSWVEKGYILYQKEFVFYVQYDNSYYDQGGTGQ